MKVLDGVYVDGAWWSAGAAEPRGGRPGDRGGRRPGRRRGGTGRGRGRTGRPRRLPRLGRHPARRARGPARRAARRDGGPGRRDRRDRHQRAGGPAEARPGRAHAAADRGRRLVRRTGRLLPLRDAGGQFHRADGAGGRGRRDHPLELPPAPDRRQGGCTRRRLRGRPQAAENTPLTARLFAEIVHEAGFPAGVFNMVCGLGPVAGQALVEHPGVDMVSFTGSTAVGRRIGALARRRRQARRPGTRRQVRERPAARRRPRPRREGDPGQRPVQLRAAVQRPDPGPRPPGPVRRGRRPRRRGRRRICARRAHRPPRQRGPARPGRRLHREGPRGGRPPGGRRPHPAADPRLLRQPDPLRRRHTGDGHRPGGDLRARRRVPPVRGRGGRAAHRQRHGLRPRGRRVGRAGRGRRLRPP